MSLSPTLAILKLFGPEPRRRFGWAGMPPEELKAVETAVAPALVELEALRRSAILSIDLLGLGLVPSGFALGALFGYATQKFPLEWLFYGGLGAFVASGLAYYGPERAYRSAYKARILPHLAARFGDLTYRAAESPDLSRLVKLGFLPDFGRKKIEDEIVGTYRGVRMSMIEAELETGGKNSRTVFNGLIVALDFPGRFSGTTVVTKDPGWMATAGEFLGLKALDRVRLEDPRFEDRYQVYGSDQIAARALLTPAVMERIMELESHSPSDPSRLLAEPNWLYFTIPKHVSVNLFEPPPLSQPVTGAGEMLAEVSRDLTSVLRFVDTVLELDPMAPPPAAQSAGSVRSSRSGAEASTSR